MLPESQQILDRLTELHPHFWSDPGYYIAQIIGLAGVLFSVLAYIEAGKAFREAKSAKEAATVAGRTVKIQSVIIDLNDIAHKLDRIPPELEFTEARDLLTEIQRRIRRSVAPFAKDDELKDAIAAVLQALQGAQSSLKAVRPTSAKSEEETPDAVYYGTQDAFDTINNCVADLLGLFEKLTLEFGEDNAGAQ